MPQIRVIDRRTRLVTITVGGNDIGLIGDLSLLALRGSGGMGAWLRLRCMPAKTIRGISPDCIGSWSR